MPNSARNKISILLLSSLLAVNVVVLGIYFINDRRAINRAEARVLLLRKIFSGRETKQDLLSEFSKTREIIKRNRSISVGLFKTWAFVDSFDLLLQGDEIEYCFDLTNEIASGEGGGSVADWMQICDGAFSE